MKRTPGNDFELYLARRVRRARKRYCDCLARSQKKFSEQAVHQLRIETRRMLALLDLLERLRLASIPERLVTKFQKRLEAFAPLRDTQAGLQRLEPMWERFPEARGFKRVLQRREEQLVARLVPKIKKTRHGGINRKLKKIEKCLDDCAAKARRQSLPAVACKVLERAFADVAALREKVRAEDAATLHCLRVGFKRFRYLSELLQPLLAMPEARFDQMKAYQDAAGDIQDLEVLIERMARAVKQRKVAPVSIRNLRSELLQQRQRATEAFIVRIDGYRKFKPQFKPQFNGK